MHEHVRALEDMEMYLQFVSDSIFCVCCDYRHELKLCLNEYFVYLLGLNSIILANVVSLDFIMQNQTWVALLH